MSDQPNQDRKLSEIGHLFLSTIRQKASNGSAPPRRIPPGQRATESAAELTPEEFEHVRIDEPVADQPPITQMAGETSVPRISALLASHLAGKQLDRAREFARHLAADGSRIGLVEVDASAFRLMCFGSGEPEAQPEPDTTESFDPAQMIEALNEMSCDVDRWLLLLPTPRIPEARAILREVNEWILLATSDHDGVVETYRALKGLTDLFAAEVTKPQLALAIFDAVDEEHGRRISAKLAGACAQFLNWPVSSSILVQPAIDCAETLVLSCRPLHDKTQVAAAPQWGIIRELVARSKAHAREDAVGMDAKKWARRLVPSDPPKRVLAEVVVPTPTDEREQAREAAPSLSTAHTSATPHHDQGPVSFPISQAMPMKPVEPDVIDLEDGGDISILSAVLHARSGEWVECPISPPMCPTARLAVGRDHRIILVALARQGLTELPNIGHAFRWLIENRGLIGMAVPQMSIDPQQPPQLSLLVDHADSSASTLRPMLQSGQVTVQTYRTLRWSGKRGLLLEAA